MVVGGNRTTLVLVVETVSSVFFSLEFCFIENEHNCRRMDGQMDGRTHARTACMHARTHRQT